jgi:zinc protease
VEPEQREPRTGSVEWPIPTLPLLTVAFRAPAYDDAGKESAALDALANLAFAPNSDLHQKLVIREQKVDMLRGGSPDTVDPTLFEVIARVKKAEDLDYVRGQILETIRTFQEKAVDAGRLDALKKRLRYSFALHMDNSDSIAGVLARYVALRRTPETINRLFDLYANITPDDVRDAARKFLVENRRTVVTLTGPTGGAK